MGQDAGVIANSALLDPNSGRAVYLGNPQQVWNEHKRELFQRARGLNLATSQPAAMPRVGTPTFGEAAYRDGMPDALSPALNKAGKLGVLLHSGLLGAMGGLSAQSQGIAATGGRWNPGAAPSFEAGYRLPFLRSLMPLQYERQLAETQLAQAGLKPVQTPYGEMPAALAARAVLPWMIRSAGTVGAAQTRAAGTENAAQTGADARRDVAEINKRLMFLPHVGLYDTEAGQLVPGTQPNAEGRTLMQQYQNALLSGNQQEIARLEPLVRRYQATTERPVREPQPKPISPAGRAGIERWKANELSKLEREYAQSQSQLTPMTADELRQRKQDV